MVAWGIQREASFRGRRVRERVRRRRTLRTVMWLFGAALVFVGIWYGTRLDTVTISTINVSGGMTINLGLVEQKAQSALGGSYLLLIPKRFSYAYPHDSVVEAIKKLPRVKDTSVERASPMTLSIVITEHVPKALWCAETGLSESDNHCLFVNEEGFAFADAPQLRGATFLRYVTEGREPEVGTALASDSYMAHTYKFAAALTHEHGMYVSAIVETKDGDVRYRLRGGGELLVSKNADIQEVFENLDAVLTSEEFAHVKSGDFAYIDLRFGNKVFVKESTEDIVATSTDAAPETQPTEPGL